jgi:hypothetical protein
MFMVIAKAFMAGGVFAQASGVEQILKPSPVLTAQTPMTPEPAPSIGPISENARILVGHWRKTTIVFEQPKDEHLVLHADGTAENWVVTASGGSATTTGRWNVEGKTLHLLLEGNDRVSQPFTIHEEQLVFPNIPNRRRFWERIER